MLIVCMLFKVSFKLSTLSLAYVLIKFYFKCFEEYVFLWFEKFKINIVSWIMSLSLLISKW